MLILKLYNPYYIFLNANGNTFIYQTLIVL